MSERSIDAIYLENVDENVNFEDDETPNLVPEFCEPEDMQNTIIPFVRNETNTSSREPHLLQNLMVPMNCTQQQIKPSVNSSSNYIVVCNTSCSQINK